MNAVKKSAPGLDIREFEVGSERGFLPPVDPIGALPSHFLAWEQAAHELPKLLATGRIRAIVGELPILDSSPLRSRNERERAMLLLSYLGHAYVWGDAKPADRIPHSLARPWCQISGHLGRPPVLSYASYALGNWRRIDANGPIQLGNIALLQNFLGGIDEEWFVLVHVAIEQQAVGALTSIPDALGTATSGDPDRLAQALRRIAASLEGMNRLLSRMPEHCDPYIYYNRVRPYLHGWKDHPSLPRGVTYDGVAEFKGEPQRFRGETGAQSSIIPSLDAALGITHQDDPLLAFLNEMRDYMPPRHRAFIETIESKGSVRDYVVDHHKNNPALRDSYNGCIEQMEEFRSTHLDYARNYIEQQAQAASVNPTSVGTGGTPFMAYLQKHRDETANHII